MTTASPPLEKAEEEAKEEVTAGAPPEAPIEESANCSPLGVVPPSQSPAAVQEEPEMGPRGAQCQSWLLEMLDDVRYLISCTNWY